VAGYCTVEDVRGRLPVGAITGSPAVALIQEKIDGRSARVNVALTAGSTPLPIPGTATDALAALLDLVANAAAFDWHASQATVYDPRFKPVWMKWDEAFEAELAIMRAGGWNNAVDPVVASSGTDEPWSFTRDADPTDPTDDRNPTYTKSYEP
jgi:hypothetical protein